MSQYMLQDMLQDVNQQNTQIASQYMTQDTWQGNYSKINSTNKLKQGSNRNQFKILVVDDDICVAETFGEVLSSRGHTITVVTEAIDCINKCQNNHYDIIFMDFHLKDDKMAYDETNGAEVTDLLKTVCSVNCIVFAITGDDSNEAIQKFKQVGMDGALIKPLDVDIIYKLMNCLELRNEVDKRVIKTVDTYQFKKHLIVFD